MVSKAPPFQEVLSSLDDSITQIVGIFCSYKLFFSILKILHWWVCQLQKKQFSGHLEYSTILARALPIFRQILDIELQKCTLKKCFLPFYFDIDLTIIYVPFFKKLFQNAFLIRYWKVD
jgi:hypothetical protein